MSGPVRQRYSIATGGGLTPAPSGPPTTPKLKKGGSVDGGFKKGAQNSSGAAGHRRQPMGKSC